MNWMNILCVFLGSGLGGACRYIIGKLIQPLAHGSLFPWGTFLVNIGGCFLIGLLYALIDKGSLGNTQIRLLATVGFCGGFTTFSTFINENYLLFGASSPQTQLYNLAIVTAYTALSLVCGFAALYAAHYILR